MDIVHIRIGWIPGAPPEHQDPVLCRPSVQAFHYCVLLVADNSTQEYM